MAMDVVPRSLGRAPVNRCLFGRPSMEDQAAFTATLTQKENEAAQRFSRRWNFDVVRDSQLTEGGQFHWIRVKSASDSNLPEFYARGYPHLPRRRALTASAGKTLTFGGEGGGAEERVCGAVGCVESPSVDLFLGVAAHHPLRAAVSADPLVPGYPRGSPSVSVISPSVPGPSTRRQGGWDEPSSSSSSSSSSSPASSSPRPRRLSQSRLTERWPARKRWRSLTPHTEPSKRERLDDDGL